MTTLLFILIILACALLVIIILAQSPKGGGLASNAFGSSVSQIFGARRGADELEKGTWYFGIGILVAVAITYFTASTISPTIGGGTEDFETTDYIPQSLQKQQPGINPVDAGASGPIGVQPEEQPEEDNQ